MGNMKLILAVMVFLSFSFFIYGLFESRFRKKSLKERLKRLDVSDEGISLEEIEMSKTFIERVLLPIFSKVGKALENRTPKGIMERLEKKLRGAGYYRTDPKAYLGIKAVLVLVLAGLVAGGGALLGRNVPNLLLFIVAIPPAGFIIPDFVLTMKADRRRIMIQDALPDFLDVITVSVEAGLGFEQALSHAGDKLSGPITDEFKRMLQELRLGKKRSDALRSLADRVLLSEVRSFCTALIQADQLGVSITDVLRVQSDGIREKRKQRSEEAAMKAPLKMLFPLIFFIFPALFIVLLGPAFISIMENFKVG